MKLIEKIKKIVQIFALPFLLGLLTIFLHLYVEQTFFTWLVAKIVVVLTLATHLLAFPALLFSLKESTPVLESYKKATRVALPFLGVLILCYILIAGGKIFLIVPGIIFLVWFVFSPYVVIFEGKKGFSALWRSKGLVRGRGWKIFGIFLPFIIFSMVLFVGFRFLVIEYFLASLVIGYILALLFNLILWLVFFRVYERREKAEVSLWSPKTYHKTLFALPILVGSVAFLFHAGLGFNVLFRDYDPPFDDSHFILPEVEMIEEGNLYIFFKEEGLIRLPDEAFDPTRGDECGVVEVADPSDFIRDFLDLGRRGPIDYHQFIRENPEQAKGIMEKNKRVHRCLDRMAEHTHYTHPGEIPMEIIRFSPAKTLPIFKANSFKAAYLFYQGNEEEALDRIVNIAKIGTLITEAPRPHSMESLVAMGIYASAFDGYPYLEKVNVSLEGAVFYAGKLAEFELTEEALARAIQMEYMDMSHGVNHTAELMEEWGEPETASFFKQPTFFWKPEQTKREFYKYYGPTIELKLEESIDLEDFYLKIKRPIDLLPFSMLVWDNMAGRVMMSATIMMFDPGDRINEIKDPNFLNRATRIALVLQAYEREMGELPDNLAELVPEYLSEVPEDPFYEGVEIGYSPDKRKLYSLRKDDMPKNEKAKYVISF